MSLSKAWLALLVCALFWPTAPTSGQASPVRYELHIACPIGNGFQFNGDASVYGCPVRATDEQDMMGDPSLAVDPLEPRNLIVGSLHGGVHSGGAAGLGSSTCDPGPTVKSRCGQVFTTFTSTDAGAFWYDNPFTPPRGLPSESYGEHPQVTIDPYGHVYVGSLYAVPNGGGAFRYVIGAQKFDSLQTINDQQARSGGAYNLDFIDPVYKGGAIGEFWFLFNPVTDNMTMVWYETPGKLTNQTNPPASNCLLGPPAPCIPPPVGASKPNSRAEPVRPGLALNGRAFDAANATSSPAKGRPVIGVVWTSAQENGTYNHQKVSDAIGPCSGSTNPVLSEGWLYIGCIADPTTEPFRWDLTAKPGTIEMFRMDPNGGTPQYIGASPVISGSPKLGVRSDGRLALVSAGAQDGGLSFSAVFGHYNDRLGRIAWSSTSSYGEAITKRDPGEKILRANVQDLIYREYSGVIHLILRETIAPNGVGATAAAKTVLPHIRKSIVAIDESNGVMAKFPLDIGNIANRTDTTLLQAPEMAYEDLSDDFLQLPPSNFTYNGEPLGDNYQREFFAVGDYGIVKFAELIEITNLRGPGIPIPQPQPPAIPAATSSVSQVLAPAGIIAFTGALVAMLALNRRKSPLAAMARKGRK